MNSSAMDFRQKLRCKPQKIPKKNVLFASTNSTEKASLLCKVSQTKITMECRKELVHNVWHPAGIAGFRNIPFVM